MKKLKIIVTIISVIILLSSCNKKNNEEVVLMDNSDFKVIYQTSIDLNSGNFIKLNVYNKSNDDLSFTVSNLKINGVTTLSNPQSYFIKSNHYQNILLATLKKYIYQVEVNSLSLDFKSQDYSKKLLIKDNEYQIEKYQQYNKDIYYQISNDYLYFIIRNDHKLNNLKVDSNVFDYFKIHNLTEEFKAYRYNLDFLSKNKDFSNLSIEIDGSELVIK